MAGALSVSIILPVLNEADHVEACIGSLRAQDYENIVEILVAAGPSVDETDDILERLTTGSPPVVVVPNPDRYQSLGLNRLLPRIRGEIVVRADAHTLYETDYVRHCVDALERTGATMVGGAMRPVGTTPFERAVAAAMTSPWAVGPSGFRQEQTEGDVDTVYLGAFRTESLRALGGYRHFPSGVAEDADLSYRLRRTGGRIVQDPRIRSTYRPRSTLRALARQFRRYGQGKAEMLWTNGEFPSWRPFAPLALSILLATALGAGVLIGWWLPLVVLTSTWLGGLLVLFAMTTGLGAAMAAVAAALMQLSYGVGLARGLVAGPGFVGDLTPVGGVIPTPTPPADDLDR